MNLFGLVRRGLWHHRVRHLGVFLGAATAAAVLVGALTVGDSVRASLRGQALARIGGVDAALFSGDRLFTSPLAGALAEALGPEGVTVAPALMLEGVASLPSGEGRANGIQVLGVDGSFFGLTGDEDDRYAGPRPDSRGVLVSRRLAEQLELAAGDALVVRVDPPSAVPRDMVLAKTDDLSLALRVNVLGVLPDDRLGRFALSAGPVPPFTVFMDLDWLRVQVEAEGRANLILAGNESGRDDAAELAERLNAEVAERWTLADGELELASVGQQQERLELRTARVFLDPPVAEVAALADAERILTYFVNELTVGDRTTPYSMVSAISAGALPGYLGGYADLTDDQVAINDWLARDLEAKVGDELELGYFALGPDRRLSVETARFEIAAVVPLEGPAADPALMPAFPGLHDAEHCRDWEAGVPIDLEAVGDEDEAYWDTHRGTPKAFLTLAAGERLWGNRFGALTAVRLPADSTTPEQLRAALREQLDPALFGLTFRDVRTPALAASAPATDFGGLFLGLSFFLLAAALLLTALLFAFGVESRAREIGTLSALGFDQRRIRRLFLLEGGLVALAGVVLGVALGLMYTRGVLAALGSVWRGAVGGTALSYFASSVSLVGGAAVSLLCALGAMFWALRGQARRPAAELVRGQGGLTAPGSGPRVGRLRLGVAASLLAALAAGVTAGSSSNPAAGFFGAGALVLVAGLLAVRLRLTARGRGASREVGSIRQLGALGSARRPGRSLATVALLASGAFLVLSVGVHHKGSEARPFERSSGTGGFALFGRSSLPVLFDLNAEEGREAFALEDDELAGVEVVPLRLREGDDASCLQLGVPQEPELLAVDPAALAARGAFSFAGTLDAEDLDGSPWSLLERDDPDGPDGPEAAVPAIADFASATWTMKKKLGDTFEYLDERGEPFRVRLVATLQGSMLQGNLIVSARAFEARYPSAGGYRAFLIDAPPERADEVAATLSAALEDVGLELTPAARRLAEFNEVQNTYLSVFQLLGGLGLLLGSLGLGLIVLRNALERRGELAALRAVGFTRAAVRRLLMAEHMELFGLGLGLGALAAAVAWVPLAFGGGAGAPSLPASVPVLLALLAVSGLIWVSSAAAVAARGTLVDALRDE